MSGYGSSYFRHDCTERGCFLAGQTSWDDLIACFPRGIRPTDVDGMVEINGHHLFLEEKRAGQTLENGQRHALAALARKPRTIVVVFRPGITSELEVLTMPNPKGYQPTSRAGLQHLLRSWAAYADSQP